MVCSGGGGAQGHRDRHRHERLDVRRENGHGASALPFCLLYRYQHHLSCPLPAPPLLQAIAAGVKVLSTLTDSDYVSVVDFSSNAVAYSDTLVQATGCAGGCTDPTGNIQPHGNLGNIKTFIEGLQATGTTNFNAAFDKAWAIFRSGGPSSNCNKILLFLTDGEPNNPWGDSENAEVKSNAAALDVHVRLPRPCSHMDYTRIHLHPAPLELHAPGHDLCTRLGR